MRTVDIPSPVRQAIDVVGSSQLSSGLLTSVNPPIGITMQLSQGSCGGGDIRKFGRSIAVGFASVALAVCSLTTPATASDSRTASVNSSGAIIADDGSKVGQVTFHKRGDGTVPPAELGNPSEWGVAAIEVPTSSFGALGSTCLDNVSGGKWCYGLDSRNVAVLREHRARQLKERDQWGAAWNDTGKVFTKEDGSWLHPETVSETFRRILASTGLPPITLRDLRHVAATLTHGGGGDLHTIKETLRHSTITLTSDTYTSLLPEVDKATAEAAAKLVPRARSASAEPAAAAPSAHASRTQKAS